MMRKVAASAGSALARSQPLQLENTHIEAKSNMSDEKHDDDA
jgi:hypothetical protein